MPVRLAVSNLAWPAAELQAALALLPGLGVRGIEAAPSRIAPWEALTPERLAGFRQRCATAGLAVPSLQALFYGRPAAQLLGDAAGFAAMREHMRQVAQAAAALGARVGVFGAMHHRRRGARPMTEALALAAERLRALADIAAPAGLALAIEPVPAAYGCDFVTTAAEAQALVRACGHPLIRPQIDVAAAAAAGDGIAASIAAAGPGLAHVHASQPGLAGFAAPLPGHAEAAGALRAAGYTGWVAVEMLQDRPGLLDQVAQAARFAARTYGLDGE